MYLHNMDLQHTKQVSRDDCLEEGVGGGWNSDSEG